MKSSTRICLLFFFAVVFSCETEPVAVTPGNVNFRWSEKDLSSGRTNDENDPKSILISINNVQGTSVHSLKKLILYKFGQEYVSENLQLMVGNYELVEFFVLDEDDNIIYATPVQGSQQSGLVDHPLPVNFAITENGNTQLMPQVLPVTEDSDAGSFGYVTFGFEIVAMPAAARIQEVWIDDLLGDFSGKYFLTYEESRLKSAAGYTRWGNDSEWILTDSMTFIYNTEGKLSQKIIQNFNLPPHYTTEKYITYTYQYDEGGKLTQMTRSGGLMVAIQIDYSYDQLGHVATAVEHRSFQTLEYEFEANSDGDVLEQKVYFLGALGRKLQYRVEFTHDQSFKNFSLDAIDLLTFDIFRHSVSFGTHNIASHKTTIFNELNGVESELSSCLNTAQYELNSNNQLKAVSYFDPNSCQHKAFDDGTEITFIY